MQTVRKVVDLQPMMALVLSMEGCDSDLFIKGQWRGCVIICEFLASL